MSTTSHFVTTNDAKSFSPSRSDLPHKAFSFLDLSPNHNNELSLPCNDSLPSILRHILEWEQPSEAPIRIMFSLNSGQKGWSLKDANQFWQQEPQGRAIISFMSSIEDSIPAKQAAAPLRGALKLSCPSHPKDRFMDPGNELLFQIDIAAAIPEYKRRREGSFQGLPVEFVVKYCRTHFSPHCQKLDSSMALSGIEYFQDLEYTRRYCLRKAALRLNINARNWIEVLAADPEATAWVEKVIQQEEQMEEWYHELLVDLRIWTFIRELQSVTFYKPNVLALLNALFPPNLSEISSKKLPLRQLQRYRSNMYDYMLAVEKDGSLAETDFVHRLYTEQSPHFWPTCRKTLESYLALAEIMIDQAKAVHGITFFRLSSTSETSTDGSSSRSGNPKSGSSENSGPDNYQTRDLHPQVLGNSAFIDSSTRTRGLTFDSRETSFAAEKSEQRADVEYVQKAPTFSIFPQTSIQRATQLEASTEASLHEAFSKSIDLPRGELQSRAPSNPAGLESPGRASPSTYYGAVLAAMRSASAAAAIKHSPNPSLVLSPREASEGSTYSAFGRSTLPAGVSAVKKAAPIHNFQTPEISSPEKFNSLPRNLRVKTSDISNPQLVKSPEIGTPRSHTPVPGGGSARSRRGTVSSSDENRLSFLHRPYEAFPSYPPRQRLRKKKSWTDIFKGKNNSQVDLSSPELDNDSMYGALGISMGHLPLPYPDPPFLKEERSPRPSISSRCESFFHSSETSHGKRYDQTVEKSSSITSLLRRRNADARDLDTSDAEKGDFRVRKVGNSPAAPDMKNTRQAKFVDSATINENLVRRTDSPEVRGLTESSELRQSSQTSRWGISREPPVITPAAARYAVRTTPTQVELDLSLLKGEAQEHTRQWLIEEARRRRLGYHQRPPGHPLLPPDDDALYRQFSGGSSLRTPEALNGPFANMVEGIQQAEALANAGKAPKTPLIKKVSTFFNKKKPEPIPAMPEPPGVEPTTSRWSLDL